MACIFKGLRIRRRTTLLFDWFLGTIDPKMNRIANPSGWQGIRDQLTRNIVLSLLSEAQIQALETQLAIVDCQKGDVLLHQGATEMAQYFILEGNLKRVVTNRHGKEMVLRFSRANDMETSYAAWRLGMPAPYSISTITKARVAMMPLPQWAQFIEGLPEVKERFELEVLRNMCNITAHIVTLHLLDAPGRVHRFQRKLPEFSEILAKKELASYLHLCPETLSRLSNQGKIVLK
jgi:CRP-like cAMP-binding protein